MMVIILFSRAGFLRSMRSHFQASSHTLPLLLPTHRANFDSLRCRRNSSPDARPCRSKRYGEWAPFYRDYTTFSVSPAVIFRCQSADATLYAEHLHTASHDGEAGAPGSFWRSRFPCCVRPSPRHTMAEDASTSALLIEIDACSADYYGTTHARRPILAPCQARHSRLPRCHRRPQGRR